MSPDESQPILVFRSGEHYMFTLGTSTKTLQVLLSSAAIGLFKSHDIGADDLARIAAQWALDRRMTTVDLALNSEHFTELYCSFCSDLDDGVPPGRLTPVPLQNGEGRAVGIASRHVETTVPVHVSDPGIPSHPGALPAVLLPRRPVRSGDSLESLMWGLADGQ